MGLRIAIFGQAPFGRDVTSRLADAGHEIVGVYAPPEGGRPDPLALLAEERGFRLLRPKRFRKKGVAIPELVEDRRTGLLAEAGDAHALADAMARLIRDPALRRRLGAAGRQRVIGEFRFDRAIDRLQDRLTGRACS